MADDTPLEISVHELNEALVAGKAVTLLDVREPHELEICKFADSLDIPMHSVPGNLETIRQAAPLVVICHSGVRSWQVTQWLRQNGVDNVSNLRGGIDSWAREIDTNMPTY